MLKHQPTKRTSKRRTQLFPTCEYNSKQKVLYDFIISLSSTQSSEWWYRVPEWKGSGEKSKVEYTSDQYLPHFGNLFGMVEEAAAIVMIEFDLIKVNNSGVQTINRDGFNTFKSLFKLDVHYIDISNVEVECLIDGEKKRKKAWFIKCGDMKLKPTQIIRQKMDAPTKNVSRETTAFIARELRMILKNSNCLDLIFKTRYYTNRNEQQNGNESSSSATGSNSESDADNDMEAKKYPLLSKFGVPLDDMNMLSSLLREITEVKREKDQMSDANIPKNSFFVSNPSNPSMSYLYMHIPIGRSKTSIRNFGKRIEELIEYRCNNNNLMRMNV